MSTPVLALPISLEQLAAVIRRMTPADQQRLLALVPELRQAALQGSPRTVEASQTVVARVRAEVLQALDGQPLSADEPFLGELTLGQYLELPDAERARLWDAWATVATEDIEERDVSPAAIPAR